MNRHLFDSASIVWYHRFTNMKLACDHTGK
jgi:hypothetical protein